MTREPAADLGAEEKNVLLTDVHDNNQWFGFGIECGHFSTWWEQELFNCLEWASPAPDLLDAFVRAWLAISLHMLHERNRYCGIQGGGSRCIKGRVLEESDWLKNFSRGLAINLNVCKSLTSHFPDAGFTKPDLILECAREIARKSRDFGCDVQLSARFLSLARAFALRFPEHAARLLQEALGVTRVHVVELLPALGQYLLKIPKSDESSLKAAHNCILEYIEEIDNPANHGAPDLVARIRVAQEEFEPHLQGHRPRQRHQSGNDSTIAELLVTSHQTSQIIAGQIADITNGDPDLVGRGIRFNTTEWVVLPQEWIQPLTAKGTTIHQNRVIVTASGGAGKTLAFDHADLTVKWPGGQLRCPCWTVRSFKHAPRFDNLGSSIVVFIYSDPPQLGAWQQYVKQLLDVKYGRQN